MLLDDFIINYPITKNIQSQIEKRNMNFLLNIENLVISLDSFSLLSRVQIVFLKDPLVFKLGMNKVNHYRNFKIIGLDLSNKIVDTDFCQISFYNQTNFTFVIDSNKVCQTCDSVYFLMNQYDKFNLNDSTYGCRIPNINFINECKNKLKKKCKNQSTMFKYQDQNIKNYVKFWQFCISSESNMKQTEQKGKADFFFFS